MRNRTPGECLMVIYLYYTISIQVYPDKEESLHFKPSIFFIRKKAMSSFKDSGGNVEELNGANSQDYQGRDEKSSESSESLSWWRLTTSLPSSLNKKKNVLFQE